MRDYRFIALTFLIGVIEGMILAYYTGGKSGALLGIIAAILFIFWGFTLFAYMRSEIEMDKLKPINIYGDKK